MDLREEKMIDNNLNTYCLKREVLFQRSYYFVQTRSLSSVEKKTINSAN